MTRKSFFRNKKIVVPFLIAIIIGIVLLLNFFFSSTSTSSIVTVLEKGYSGENEEAWIIVVPPNTSIELQNEYKIQITIKEPMVWNLLEEGRTYSVDYKTWNSEKTLRYIRNVMDEQAIPR
ncbi:hypothetical protein NXY55_21980 [Aeromonas veronii]|nr:hypothetical protein [Aeromonas veronii]